MDYLKLFQTHQEYEEFVSGGTMVRPNVSHCVSENEVHYNGTPYVTVIDVENIVKNSTTNESHGMTYYYENSAFGYGTAYTNINPTFHFDGYYPISAENELGWEGFYERYVTDEMSRGDNKCYIYRNPSTDEWFFYCDGDRGGYVYWIWAFSEMCDDETYTFCTKYVPNKAYIKTNVNTPPILPPSIVSVNGVEPNGILSGDVKNVTVVLDKAFDLTKYMPDFVSMKIGFGGENIHQETIASSEDNITWIGEFEETLSINENIAVYLFGVDSNDGMFGVGYAEFTSA